MNNDKLDVIVKRRYNYLLKLLNIEGTYNPIEKQYKFSVEYLKANYNTYHVHILKQDDNRDIRVTISELIYDGTDRLEREYKYELNLNGWPSDLLDYHSSTVSALNALFKKHPMKNLI